MIGSLTFFGLILVIVFTGLVTVNQGTIAVITMFGKYRRIFLWVGKDYGR